MKKNDTVELYIEDVTAEGSGVGRIDGLAVFVPHTAPGDRVRAKIIKLTRSYGVAKPEKILSPARCRIEPDCPCYGRCGGCAFRHMTYEAECDFKRKRVDDCLRRIGGLTLTVEEMIPSPVTQGYRNKAQYPVGRNADGQPVLGFYAPRSHRVVDARHCPLQPPVFGALCDAFLDYLLETDVSIYDETTGKGLVRHLYLRTGFATGQTQAVVVINGQTVPRQDLMIQHFTRACPDITGILLNRNLAATNVILGEDTQCLYGAPTIRDTLMGVDFDLSPHTFYQVNPAAAQRLFERAAAYANVGPQDTVLDLYCGMGAVGLCAAKGAGRLVGVEIVPQAVENATLNARRAGVKHAAFYCADAAQAARELAGQGVHPNVVFLDPPRKGCEPALLQTVAKDFCPERLVYISCDPATLARDLAVLATFGYATQRATAVDLFPRTGHVETVCLLSRQ